MNVGGLKTRGSDRSPLNVSAQEEPAFVRPASPFRALPEAADVALDWRPYHANIVYDIHDLRDLPSGSDQPCVYFLRSGAEGPIKIGYSTTAVGVSRRRNQCQTGNPDLVVVCRIVEGDRKLESKLHQFFAPLHIRGEWFSPAPELVRFSTPSP